MTAGYPTGTLYVGKDGAWQELGAIDSEGFVEPVPGYGIPVVESDLVPDSKAYLVTEPRSFTIDFQALPADGALFGPEVYGPRDPLFSLAFESEERIPRPQRPLRPWQPWRQRRYRRALAAWQRAAQAWEDGDQVRRMRTLIPRAVLT